MRLVFFSNFLNHHQKALCDNLYAELNGSFVFVATEKVPAERLSMGYYDYQDVPYLLKAYESEEKHQEALKLSLDSDALILGDASEEYIEGRLKQNKLSFRYNERFFKNGRWHILDPRVFKARWKRDFGYRNKNLYMLCASAYTATDCRFIFSYPKKTYRWGYFPQVNEYKDIEKLIDAKKTASILWAGRLLGWKHPEDTVELAKRLVKDNVAFHLEIIGEGEKKEELLRLIQEYRLESFVTLVDFLPPEAVREKMEKADIYLFTSDQSEGWGAVLNEAMNSACAVIANQEIGSVPYLVKDGKNGLIYRRKKKDDLYQKVKYLLENPTKKRQMQIEAYQTMISSWSPKEASKRLLHLIESLESGKRVEYKDGPCSEDF